MGELTAPRRYAYWGDRRIREFATDNDLNLGPRGKRATKIRFAPFLPEFEFGQESRTLRRAEIAERVEAALGIHAVEDFVTPLPVRFAKGTGLVSFAEFAGYHSKGGVVIHTTMTSSTGVRVAVCLFGSLHNTADYLGARDKFEEGWSSSAAWEIEKFLRDQGGEGAPTEDLEYLSTEALKICRHQGETGRHEEHAGKPHTRGFTLGHAEDSEWLAEIYSDVVLDKQRWLVDWEVDRIVIGAPFWVRTPSPQAITRYRNLRAAKH